MHRGFRRPGLAKLLELASRKLLRRVLSVSLTGCFDHADSQKQTFVANAIPIFHRARTVFEIRFTREQVTITWDLPRDWAWGRNAAAHKC